MSNVRGRLIARRSLAFLALLLFAAIGSAAVPGPAAQYSGTNFGDGNLPTGCILDMARDNPDNICHHMKVGLNALDSPQIDVVVLVPASAGAERDMRIMRQAVEAWEGGLHYLAEQMGLRWFADGVDFHITVDVIDLTGGEGGEFTTYPLYDPEIVVVATNPTGGLGIGVDPVDFFAEIGSILTIYDDEDVPCHNVQNPFDLEYWEALPGFDSHHEYRGGTYTEDCGGAGGNVCFSVNGSVDAFPGVTDMFSLFDLVLHETGHCLTLGHVGDGADGDWGPVPTNDIMAYSYDPPGLNKCVSTLNVEGLALRMSRYLDVDGDGEIDDADLLEPNDVEGDGLNSFQVQHPDDHLYASSTGSAWDCPQPDLGVLPGEQTSWVPEPEVGIERLMQVSSPADGARSTTGTFHVAGNVTEAPPGGPPTETTAMATDPTGDSSTVFGDLEQLDVEVTADEVVATVKVAQLFPDMNATSVVAYSVSIGFQQIDSFVDPQSPGEVTTYDHSYERPLPSEWSEWDVEAGTITFRIPRRFLADVNQTAPYEVVAWTNVEANYKFHLITDDRAPDTGRVLVAAPPMAEGDPVELPENPAVDPLDLLLEAFGGGPAECEDDPETDMDECADSDGDGVLDGDDPCPNVAGAINDGCPLPQVREVVNLYVDGAFVLSTDVDTSDWADAFATDVELAPGTHELTLEWEKRGRVIASDVRVVHVVDGVDGVDGNANPLPTTGGGVSGLSFLMLLLAFALTAWGRLRAQTSTST